ncbi:hypothetical protein L6452_24135 [Arctium lappa]|uniref:Uncharacterized protein n=1 Tax=Arctium lappa TaxID=4217 RepID=A0ACB9A9H1_ARCLA|nr:hypothetical protein L6452_24135 [Arctium lappa]
MIPSKGENRMRRSPVRNPDRVVPGEKPGWGVPESLKKPTQLNYHLCNHCPTSLSLSASRHPSPPLTVTLLYFSGNKTSPEGI